MTKLDIEHCIDCGAPLPDDRVWWCARCSLSVKQALRKLDMLALVTALARRKPWAGN